MRILLNISFLIIVFLVSPSVSVAIDESVALPVGAPLLPGCASSYGYSIVNGLPCSDGSFAPVLSELVNIPASATGTPILPAGCSTSYGFSIFNGQPCTGKVTAKVVQKRDIGAPLSGWEGWQNPAPVKKATKIYFSRPLDIGSRGDDVRLLQSFLAKDPYLYPEGFVNGYFGLNTARAVGRLQLQYGLVSGEDESTFGYVGPRTRALLNSLQQ